MGILSVQSHVSFGHVGNAAAVFILRRMGFDVWPVHTVLFSNHPGYGDFGGTIVEAPVIRRILDGLEARALFARCEAIIGGYLGSADTGHAMLECVAKIRQSRSNPGPNPGPNSSPGTTFYLDPVMGDRDSGVYVRPEIVSFYRDHGIACADIVKCNAFELEVLSAQPVTDVSSAMAAAQTLIDRHGTRAIVITSVPVSDGQSLSTVAVSRAETRVVTTPVIPVEQKGAGDAFMALFVANHLRVPDQTGMALSRAVSSIWGLMRKTCDHGGDELQLIAAQEQLMTPEILYEANRVA